MTNPKFIMVSSLAIVAALAFGATPASAQLVCDINGVAGVPLGSQAPVGCCAALLMFRSARPTM